MANALYDLYKTALLAADTNVSLNVNTATDGPFCVLIDTGTYTFNQTHQFYSSLTGIVSTEQRIVTPTVGTVAAGVFDGADVTYTTVVGATVEALVIHRKNAGANTLWRLVAFMDTSITGLPITPNGGDITVTWHASGIFKL